MKLTQRGEFQIIDYLKAKGKTGPGLVCGIGDDCAIARIAADEELLTTADLLTEGVHFDLTWTDLFRLGRKAVSVNVSDLAAMAGLPRYLFLSLALPDSMTIEQIDQLLAGFLQACDEYDAVLAGGDTCRSAAGLTLSVSAQGTAARGRAIRRTGAGPGDDLYVTGSLGDSALALRQLQSGRQPDPFLLGRHLDPTARIACGRALAAATVPTAMIDISDGLLADLQHLLDGSGVGAVIEQQNLPLSTPFRRELGVQPQLIELALAGGEDYELLFSAPEQAAEAVAEVSRHCQVPITRIGRIVSAGEGLRLLGPDGELPLPARRGYKHFPETA